MLNASVKTVNAAGAALGSPCTTTTDCDDAVTSITCDTTIASPKCALGPTADCTADQQSCVNGATCVSNECTCGTDYTDGTNGICKAKLGIPCIDTAGCDVGTVVFVICDTSLSAPVCAIAAGGTCSGATTNCISPATCTGSSNTICECPSTYETLADGSCYICSGAMTAGVSVAIALMTLLVALM
ncbi:uncharacterized protein LOC127842642 [Dreissena polymorpha]|nr:uncharacterized protein LOC127842642 [Dreissena polymorpha]